jgi:HD-GYP domain-containing protein (c-di-GMP phosphodiesterase class II)
MSSDADRPSHSSAADQALALNLSVAIRTAAYYDADNAVMQQVCGVLRSQVADHCEETGSVRVGIHSHCVFIGSARVRATVSTYARLDYLIQLFDDWGINTLTFHAGISESDIAGLVLVMAREKGERLDRLSALLRQRGVQLIEVDLTAEGGVAQAIAPVEAYAAAVQVGGELRDGSETGEQANVRKVRHVTQAVVDQIMSDPRSLIALTTIKEFDQYLISHSTNVAILSVLLGQRLGLSKARLGELCLSAFLHDAGKLEVAPEILHKAGPLDSDEWREIRTHPIVAARSLLSAGRLTAPGMRAVVVAFEHHLNFDMSGYPPTKIKEHVTLFGNIVTLADRYDALTTPRPYRKINFTPHEALTYLVSHSGTYFDPALVKLFVEIMGVYPPGSLVELSSGELALVCEPPIVGRSLERPKVRLLTGERLGSVVDLDEQDEGGYGVAIARVLNPANKGQLPAIDASVFEVQA